MPERRKNATNGTKATNASHSSPASHPSHPEGFIPPHGGYEKLFGYSKSQIIYDATARFCDRFISIKSRTHDQMVQAARSGNKNIAEGSQVSGTSKESEIKLTNVARGSLEELLGDYQDYLRQHGLRLWDKNSREALFVRKLGAKPDTSYESYKSLSENALWCENNFGRSAPVPGRSNAALREPLEKLGAIACCTVLWPRTATLRKQAFQTGSKTYIETRPPEVVANILICLIHQANYLLDQQLRRLEKDFLEQGGLRERMTRARLAARAKQRPFP